MITQRWYRAARLIALGLAVTLYVHKPQADATSNIGQQKTTDGKGPATKPSVDTESRKRPSVPPPPPLLSMPLGEPAEQAKALALATATEEANAGSAWLTVYDTFGIPVLNGGEPIGTTGDDPIGPPWWAVWTMGSRTKNQNVTVPLTDVMRMFAVGSETTDYQAGATLLLEDIRNATTSANPQAQRIGRFIADRIRMNPGAVDILAPNLSPDRVYIDVATSHFLYWVVLRSSLHELAKRPRRSALSTMSAGLLNFFVSDAFAASRGTKQANRSPYGTPPKFDCEKIWGGSEDATGVVNWFINKALAS